MEPLSFALRQARRHSWPLVVTMVSVLLFVRTQLLVPWIIKFELVFLSLAPAPLIVFAMRPVSKYLRPVRAR